eukprot:CAMPEP_0194489696 /NCGR_PEP_ID=MMETSP0253-20130528/9148_1 /TAXON_ID=2966 /ORGANISM="Noctiluca scintillans" /LENGTH=168 /DNA_ID=CAMNT_0039330199 /DNA_START=46 /DNA_END=550 /DNA_ORIENTATION=+
MTTQFTWGLEATQPPSGAGPWIAAAVRQHLLIAAHLAQPTSTKKEVQDAQATCTHDQASTSLCGSLDLGQIEQPETRLLLLRLPSPRLCPAPWRELPVDGYSRLIMMPGIAGRLFKTCCTERAERRLQSSRQTNLALEHAPHATSSSHSSQTPDHAKKPGTPKILETN